jgi:hypothetical protein
MNLKTIQTKVAFVQTATAWPSDDDGWQSEPELIAHYATASIVGTGKALISANYGNRIDIKIGPSFLQIPVKPTGKYCRIIVEDESGEIVLPFPGFEERKFAPMWWGRIKNRGLKPDNADKPAAPANIDAVWISECFTFDRLHTHETSQFNEVVINYKAPVFNILPGGDMSNDTYEIDGTETHVFDRFTGNADPEEEPEYRKWTYAAALQYLCASARPEVPNGGGRGGPKLFLGDYPEALDEAELPNNAGSGRSTDEIIKSLINPSIGMVPVYRVTDHEIFLDVMVVAQENFTIGKDERATPPRTGVVVETQFGSGETLELAGNQVLKDVEFIETDSGRDYIQVNGGEDVYSITFQFSKGDDPNSDDEAETNTFTAFTWEPDSEQPRESDNSWRLFRIHPEWDGKQYDSTTVGMPQNIRHTAEGCNSERTYVAGDTEHPENDTLNFLRELPWSEIRDDGTKLIASRPTPRLFALKNNRAEDMTGEIPIIPMGNGLFRLGTSGVHARQIQELYYNGYTLLLSIGVFNWHPMLATWLKAQNRTSDIFKTIVIERASTEMTTALTGTVSRVKEDGTLDKIASDIVVKADMRGLMDLRDAMAGRYKHDEATLTFRDMTSCRPSRQLGAPIDKIIAGSGEAALNIETKVAITGWTANFGKDNYGVNYECLRLIGK